VNAELELAVRRALDAHPNRVQHSRELGAWVWRHDRSDGESEGFWGPTPQAAVRACVALRGRP
jgi:hypothetical protein